MLSPNISHNSIGGGHTRTRTRTHTHARTNTHTHTRARANTERDRDRQTERTDKEGRREERTLLAAQYKTMCFLMKNACTVKITYLFSGSSRFKTPCSSVLISVCRLGRERKY